MLNIGNENKEPTMNTQNTNNTMETKDLEYNPKSSSATYSNNHCTAALVPVTTE